MILVFVMNLSKETHGVLVVVKKLNISETKTVFVILHSRRVGLMKTVLFIVIVLLNINILSSVTGSGLIILIMKNIMNVNQIVLENLM
jgi:hypothetical protein